MSEPVKKFSWSIDRKFASGWLCACAIQTLQYDFMGQAKVIKYFQNNWMPSVYSTTFAVIALWIAWVLSADPAPKKDEEEKP